VSVVTQCSLGQRVWNHTLSASSDWWRTSGQSRGSTSGCRLPFLLAHKRQGDVTTRYRTVVPLPRKAWTRVHAAK